MTDLTLDKIKNMLCAHNDGVYRLEARENLGEIVGWLVAEVDANDAISEAQGRFMAYRTLWKSWLAESNMEVRETDRWMIGFCERYINEIEGQFTRELSRDQISAFFDMRQPSNSGSAPS